MIKNIFNTPGRTQGTSELAPHLCVCSGATFFLRSDEMEKTVSRDYGDYIVTVTVIRKVRSKQAYADGWEVDCGRETYDRTDVTISKGDRQITSNTDWIYPAEYDDPRAYARFGDNQISEEAYDRIQSLISEAEAGLVTTDEYKQLKAAEKDKKAQAEKERAKIQKLESVRRASGYCDKCGTYCDGDCEYSC